MSVHVKEAVLITPSEPTPSTILQLSAVDSQLFLRFTIEYLLVYKPYSDLDKIATAERVKAALGRALIPYFPLAGRVRARPGDSGLEVVCSAQGALFIEAVSDHTVSEFERAPRFGTQWGKLLSLHVADVLKGAPPLVVQLTWLSDNAATLGVGFNHCLIDGIGSAEFLNSVAELASGRCSGLTELNPKPIWDRHIMDPTNFKPGNRVSHPEFNRVADLCGFESRYIKERLAPTSVTFNKVALNELKTRVALGSWPCESFTSFEVLAAHVWRSWARAMNFPSNQELKLLFSTNVRNRVQPSLPEGYYGNAFVLGCAQTSVKDLSDRGLHYATKLVKRAKERIDDGYVRGVIESVSSTRACPDSVGVLIVSQWSRLGLDRIDFGLEKPVHVGPVCCDRYCLLLPVYNEPDAVKVNVAVPATAVDHYLCHLKNAYT